MRIDEVKNLVSMLYDMELNNYMMSCCIQNIAQTMSGLKKRRIISKPIYTVTSFQKKKNKFNNCVIIGALIGFILGGIIALIIGWNAGSRLDVALTAPFAIIYYGTIVGVIGTFIGIIIGCVQTKRLRKKTMKIANYWNYKTKKIINVPLKNTIMIAEKKKNVWKKKEYYMPNYYQKKIH